MTGSTLQGLNPQQEEAVRFEDGPMLILAGAGSGKTRVLTNRIAWLIDKKGVNPWNILAITFTNKAAGEMKERVEKLVGFGGDSVWVSTFHSMCVRILRRHISLLEYDPNFAIYDTDDQKALIKDACARCGIDTKLFKERMFMSMISHAKEELIAPEEFARTAGKDNVSQKAALVYREYQKALKKNNALDFDDLLVKTAELFSQHEEVLSYYQDRFRYIMVDEYQDTNTAQFELVRLLSSRYRNLCVVGDDDQSIYRFRGANIQNILSFEKIYPDAKVIRLEENYRSTPDILNVANAVISNNKGRKEKRLWTQKEKGDPVRYFQFQTAIEEAEFIADDIESTVQEGKYEYRDQAVLYRTNAQSRLLEEKLLTHNIPYRIVGGINFYSRREIKDILAYLKTIDNARDDLSVRRIINIPRRGIGATTIERVADYAAVNGMSFYSALEKAREIPGAGRAAGKIRDFVTFIRSLRAKAQEEGVRELIEDVIRLTGYAAELQTEGTDEAKDRLGNIDELISKAADYERGSENPSLREFLEEVALVADIDSLEEDRSCVLLMTLHSAKGLEFKRVYMTGMEDGVFPSYMSITSDNPHEEIEEERRLCYVGITRAMEELTLTGAYSRMLRGQVQYSRESRFIQEIPDELLKREQGADLPYSFRQNRSVFANGNGSGSFASRQFEQSVFSSKGASDFRAKQGKKPAFGTYDLSSFKADKNAKPDYEEGDRVSHRKYGQGLVEKIEQGAEWGYTVTVRFDEGKTRKLVASFANLKKI